jgi:hypothetical protein
MGRLTETHSQYDRLRVKARRANKRDDLPRE